MSNATFEEELARYHVAERTDDPDRRERQRKLLRLFLDALPEEHEKLKNEGRLKARSEAFLEGRLEVARNAIRLVLQARQHSILPDEGARIDACSDLNTLRRWLVQAVTAASTTEALR